MHDKTRRTTDEALAGLDASWVRPKVSGRWVTLEGTPPGADAASAAYEAVRTARSGTLFGKGIQATRVFENFNKVTAAPAVAPRDTGLNPETPPRSNTAVIDHSWRFERKDGVMTLTGEVPDEATRRSLLETTEFTLSDTRIVDQLLVTGRPAKDGYAATALRGIQTLGRCKNGFTRFERDVFSLDCETEEQDSLELRRLASAPIALGSVGTIEIIVTEDIANCENRLSDLLSNTRIEFETASAVINPSSAELLTSIALEAQNCPGTLRIEGHTDNRGSQALNAELSEARANAVRLALVSRGLAVNRLATEGYGEARPIASNDTEAGRARNRRIQFRVVRP